MSLPNKRNYLSAFRCPVCESPKLRVTREKIILCEGCYGGFRMVGDVPDFRIENMISFKKEKTKIGGLKDAVLTVVMGEQKDLSFPLKVGHCVVLGRQSRQNEETAIGTMDHQNHYLSLDGHNRKLAEKYLSKPRRPKPPSQNMHHSGFFQAEQTLGEFLRDPDFLMQDTAISKTHAIIYQSDEGVRIVDLVSRNGTFVNGTEIESRRLKENDVVSLGNTTLKLSFY